MSERSAAIAAAEAAMRDAQARIALCEDTLETFDELTRRLRYALAVPSDRGGTYESVYNLIRRGRAACRTRAVDHQAGSGNSMSGGNLPLRAAAA